MQAKLVLAEMPHRLLRASQRRGEHDRRAALAKRGRDETRQILQDLRAGWKCVPRVTVGRPQEQHVTGDLFARLRGRRSASTGATQIAGVDDGAARQLAVELRAPQDVAGGAHGQRQ